ncbi:efflux RND transporter permease subunit, partial [Paraburkholderia caribensis]
MTSLAFILGCVPLAIATGASANSRHSIGTGVIGGMLGATAIAVFFIPMFFYVLETMSERSEKKKAKKAGDAPPSAPGSGAGPTPGEPKVPPSAGGPTVGGGPTTNPSAPREDD